MLQISHLSADYGGKPALADINLTLDSGELLVVLGPSGCGKTTLLNLIAGFVPYQHGSITLEGQRVEGPGAERGVVFQHEGLLPWRNVQDNVALGLQLAGVDKAARRETAVRMLAHAAPLGRRLEVVRTGVVEQQEGADLFACGVVGKQRTDGETVADPMAAVVAVTAQNLLHGLVSIRWTGRQKKRPIALKTLCLRNDEAGRLRNRLAAFYQ